MTSHRSRTVFSNTRPPSLLPEHTRYQANVYYGLAKRVLPKTVLKRKRPKWIRDSASLLTSSRIKRRSYDRQYCVVKVRICIESADRYMVKGHSGDEHYSWQPRQLACVLEVTEEA